MRENSLRIGAVAAQAGVNVQTLRYYERRGLLPRAERTPSGYRRYDADAARVVRFIKRAQDLGFTLREVHDLLRLRAASHPDRRGILKLATAKIADIDQRIDQLSSIRGALADLIASCDCKILAPQCSILEALDDAG